MAWVEEIGPAVPRYRSGMANTDDQAQAVTSIRCSCCGEERDPAATAALQCHDDVRVCRGCIAWLRSNAVGLTSTPTLPVADMDEAVAFYRAAGFEVGAYEGGGFAFVTHDDESVFDLDLIDDLDCSTNPAGCYLIAADLHTWHTRLTDLGATVTAVEDMPWGMREFTLTDPSGNHLRFGTSIG
jgi:catechol 2,3-dioxygenase-like lactoylglutathione lyase family enzyme